MDRRYTWHCEPPDWREDLNTPLIVTGAETDFWQGTFYGFRRDDGHFRHTPVTAISRRRS